MVTRRQIAVASSRLRKCDHRGKMEHIVTMSGKRMAGRCAACHKVVSLKQCRGCRRMFRLNRSEAAHNKLYHSQTCRRAAYRRRRLERELGGVKPAPNPKRKPETSQIGFSDAE